MEYIDHITLEDLRELAEKRAGYCVSLYLPTERMSKEIRQNPIRLKNLLARAEEELVAVGMRRPEASSFLRKARDFVGENPFWQHQSDGLALFISSDAMRSFRLPVAFEEVVVVSDRFHLKPLLSLFTGDGRYYVLALSQNEVRLLHCTRHSAFEVKVDGMPASLADVLKYDTYEEHLQFHTKTAGVKAVGKGAPGRAGEGRRPAIFHGQGGRVDVEKSEITQYFLQIDRSLQKALFREQAPLVLAGVDFLFPIYREVNTYQHLLEEGVEGNPEILKPEELQRQAWSVVEPVYKKGQADAADRFRQEIGTGHASVSIEEIVPAAAHGRVDVLFIAAGKHQWGVYNPVSQEVHLHDTEEPGDEDLLNAAAIQTVLHGGTVYVVSQEEVPADVPAAALFRY